MACALIYSDKLPSKRTRAQLQDDCVDSSITEGEIQSLKRSHLDEVAQPDSLFDFSRGQQRSLGSTALLGSESLSECLDIEAARVLVLQEGKSRPAVEEACLERDSDGAVGDSTSGSCLASFKKSDCTGYSAGAGELAASACHPEPPNKSLHAAESWCGDDAQIDIACFLESWDDSIGDLLSAPHCLFEDNHCGHASLTGASDVLSALEGVGEGDWCFNDAAVEAKRLWNDPSEQEWMAVAVASLDRFSDDLELQS